MTAEENDISLYNALHDEPLPEGTEIEKIKVIEECIKKGILSEYLQRKGSEVRNMLIAEYDYDMDIEVQREEAYEDGEKAGENRINDLYGRLIKDNRMEDLKRSVNDKEYQEELMKEYGL